MNKRITNNLMLIFSLCLASAFMKTVIQAPFDVSWLAWISMVPFAIACCEAKSVKWMIAISYLTLAGFWVGNLYWISYVTTAGWLAFSLFSGIYWPVIFVGIRFCNAKRVPLFISLPVLLCGAEALQGIFFRGFDWHLLGHSQYEWLGLVQIADIVGVPGITFIIGMVNGLTAGCLIRIGAIIRTTASVRKTLKPLAAGAIATALLFGAILYYGRFRLSESTETISSGPLIAAIQPNFLSSIKEDHEAGEEILQSMLKQSRECADSGAKLIIWPETMVLCALNGDYLAYCPQEADAWTYHDMISEFASQGYNLLVGASAVRVGERDGKLIITDQYNSAFIYLPDGSQSVHRYNKIHLVPFGEYIPFNNIKLIKKLLMLFNPYDYDYSLTRGDQHTLFRVKLDGQDYAFSSMICYEDTDAELVRNLAYSGTAGKKADWIANLSNDGWYVRHENGKFIPSVELPQRTAISIFRAIENRIAIIRSVNSGISCIIEPTGKLRDGFAYGNLPRTVMARQAVSGWFSDNIPIDSRDTFFSEHGLWINRIFTVLIIICFACGLFTTKKASRH